MRHERITGRNARHAHRAERIEVTIVCEVRQGTRPWRMARLDELSTSGFRIAWLPDARPQMPLRIRIPGMHLLSARIAWQQDNTVGCEFTEPLHVAVFEHIARSSRA